MELLLSTLPQEKQVEMFLKQSGGDNNNFLHELFHKKSPSPIIDLILSAFTKKDDYIQALTAKNISNKTVHDLLPKNSLYTDSIRAVLEKHSKKFGLTTIPGTQHQIQPSTSGSQTPPQAAQTSQTQPSALGNQASSQTGSASPLQQPIAGSSAASPAHQTVSQPAASAPQTSASIPQGSATPAQSQVQVGTSPFSSPLPQSPNPKEATKQQLLKEIEKFGVRELGFNQKKKKDALKEILNQLFDSTTSPAGQEVLVTRTVFDTNGKTLLSFFSKKPDLMRACLNSLPENVYVRAIKGTRALLDACIGGNLESVNLLLGYYKETTTENLEALRKVKKELGMFPSKAKALVTTRIQQLENVLRPATIMPPAQKATSGLALVPVLSSVPHAGTSPEIAIAPVGVPSTTEMPSSISFQPIQVEDDISISSLPSYTKAEKEQLINSFSSRKDQHAIRDQFEKLNDVLKQLKDSSTSNEIAQAKEARKKILQEKTIKSGGENKTLLDYARRSPKILKKLLEELTPDERRAFFLKSDSGIVGGPNFLYRCCKDPLCPLETIKLVVKSFDNNPPKSLLGDVDKLEAVITENSRKEKIKTYLQEISSQAVDSSDIEIDLFTPPVAPLPPSPVAQSAAQQAAPQMQKAAPVQQASAPAQAQAQQPLASAQQPAQVEQVEAPVQEDVPIEAQANKTFELNAANLMVLRAGLCEKGDLNTLKGFLEGLKSKHSDGQNPLAFSFDGKKGTVSHEVQYLGMGHAGDCINIKIGNDTLRIVAWQDEYEDEYRLVSVRWNNQFISKTIPPQYKPLFDAALNKWKEGKHPPGAIDVRVGKPPDPSASEKEKETDLNNQYKVWYNPKYGQLNIQRQYDWFNGEDENKLGIIISPDGKITSVRVNNEPQGSLDIPEQWLAPLQACFNKVLDTSSTYQFVEQPGMDKAPIQVMALKRGLREIPEYHLKQFAECIEKAVQSSQDPKITVTFLKDDLSKEVGIDAGGLTRDYIDDLMRGITERAQLPFNTDLFLPKATAQEKPTDPLIINAREKEIYRELGIVFMYCYHSEKSEGIWDRSYSTGRHFDDALFKVAFSLTSKEIDQPFEKLSFERQFELCKALVGAYDKQTSSLQSYNKMLEWIGKDNILGEQDEIKVYIEHVLPENAVLTNEVMKEALKKVFVEGFTGELAAIHAIAGGMKQVYHPGSVQQLQKNSTEWDRTAKTHSEKFVEVSNKVQGSINRDDIAKSIEIRSNLAANQEIFKKTTWLKEWITGKNAQGQKVSPQASEEELKNFLKFVTGSTSLPKDKKITVGKQHDELYPVPKAHTCSFEMELSPQPATYGNDFNDHTKENFIKSLVGLALVNPSAYQVA
jgi:hypothetical protein